MRCHGFKNSSQGLLLKLQSASFVAIHFLGGKFFIGSWTGINDYHKLRSRFQTRCNLLNMPIVTETSATTRSLRESWHQSA